MPIYEYRCDQHGVSEITRPLGKAPKSVPCLVCGGEAKRVFSVGMIRTASRGALLAAMDHEDSSSTSFKENERRGQPPLERKIIVIIQSLSWPVLKGSNCQVCAAEWKPFLLIFYRSHQADQ